METIEDGARSNQLEVVLGFTDTSFFRMLILS